MLCVWFEMLAYLCCLCLCLHLWFHCIYKMALNRLLIVCFWFPSRQTKHSPVLPKTAKAQWYSNITVYGVSVELYCDLFPQYVQTMHLNSLYLQTEMKLSFYRGSNITWIMSFFQHSLYYEAVWIILFVVIISTTSPCVSTEQNQQ